jgi:serine/threonine protein kinase
MIAPNTLLQNRYLVLNQIGQGGMGAVYVATDQRFGSTVALKETFFTDAGLRKAFEREARLLNHLRHPALPRVSDHFVEDEGQFLVMEYIAGDDLAEKLKERGGAFTSSEVLNWADQLLDALDYLHTQEPSIIHRDIKPQNLKLTPRNAIVLLDFGLAKGSSAVQTKVTATGSVFGYSRNYAPLEQIQGAGTDPRSDLYSLGATLYHLITGVTPPDALTRATAVLNGHPDPLLPADKVHAQVTPAVAEVLSKAMAQNASQRPQTAAAMRDTLREAARQGHTTSSAARDAAGALPIASQSNVYEQDTQLMFAASPSTSAGEQAGETGTARGLADATALNSATAAGAAGSTRSSESELTKVAGGGPTTLKNHPRTRIFAVAASVVVLAVVAMGVYTLTRNPAATPSANESVEGAPALPPPTNTAGQTNQAAPETVEQHTPAVPATEKQATATPGKPTKVIIKGGHEPKTETRVVVGDEDERPEPPDPDTMPQPPRHPRRVLRPGDPEFEEAMREAEEARQEAQREGAKARRDAREQRRLMLIKQRQQILERERRRQQQQP